MTPCVETAHTTPIISANLIRSLLPPAIARSYSIYAISIRLLRDFVGIVVFSRKAAQALGPVRPRLKSVHGRLTHTLTDYCCKRPQCSDQGNLPNPGRCTRCTRQSNPRCSPACLHRRSPPLGSP